MAENDQSESQNDPFDALFDLLEKYEVTVDEYSDICNCADLDLISLRLPRISEEDWQAIYPLAKKAAEINKNEAKSEEEDQQFLAEWSTEDESVN